MRIKERLLNILISFDQTLFCLLTLGYSKPDETLSAASYRWELAGKTKGKLLRPLIDCLFFFDPYHCKTSYESELNGNHLPEEYRTG